MTRKEKIEHLLSKGYTFDIDKGEVYGTRKKESIGYINSNGYKVIKFNSGKNKYTINIHQFIYYVSTGELPECIDHINRVKSDNRISNLRPLTNQENILNTNTKGYSYSGKSNKYIARIQLFGKTLYLGSFNSESEASDAYIKAKEEVHIIGDLSLEKLNNYKERIVRKLPKNYSYNKGVNKYVAEVTRDNKRYTLGYYSTESEVKLAIQEYRSNPKGFNFKATY